MDSKSEGVYGHRRTQSVQLDKDTEYPDTIVEFTPPKCVLARDISSDKVPKSYNISNGQRILYVRLDLPGLKFKAVEPVESRSKGFKKWPLYFLNCRGNRHSRNHSTADTIGCGNFGIKFTDPKSLKYNLAFSERWWKADATQQPTNGELWYRITPNRIQLTVLLNVKPGDECRANKFARPSETAAESFFSSSDDSLSVTSCSLCPRYYYWDSGRLEHVIDLSSSKLITTETAITCYFTISGMRSKQPIWSKTALLRLEASSSRLNAEENKFCAALVRRASTTEYDAILKSMESPKLRSLERSFTSDDFENSEYYHVTLDRRPGQSLGLTLVEKTIKLPAYPVDHLQPMTGLFIKGMTPGGLAERSGKLNVGDQLLAINSVSILLPPQQTQSEASEPRCLPANCTSLGLTDYTDKLNHPEKFKRTIEDMRHPAVLDETSPLQYASYMFAMRLLRQAVGPLRLSMKRSGIPESCCHQNEIEATRPQADKTDSVEPTINKMDGDEVDLSTGVQPRGPKETNVGETNTDLVKETKECPSERDLKETTTEVSEASRSKHFSMNIGDTVYEKQEMVEDQDVLEVDPQTKLPDSPISSTRDTTDKMNCTHDVVQCEQNATEVEADVTGIMLKENGQKIAKLKKTMRISQATGTPHSVGQGAFTGQPRYGPRDIGLYTGRYKKHTPKQACSKESPNVQQGSSSVSGKDENQPEKPQLVEPTPLPRRRQHRTHSGTKQEGGVCHSENHHRGNSSPTNRAEREHSTPSGEPRRADVAQTRLATRLAALEEYLMTMPPDKIPMELHVDANDVDYFQEIIANLTDEEWQALLQVLMQPTECDFDREKFDQHVLQEDGDPENTNLPMAQTVTTGDAFSSKSKQSITPKHHERRLSIKSPAQKIKPRKLYNVKPGHRTPDAR
ncbi:PDZ/DHR/GLGF domain protein [Opisthorchis viverrini]|uniref:PDZ/DHR/GLGF domain protein n=1 Tax=Opisthorchis viverrini TaxID=6198 RepID=A0A1S8WMI2_OPIVI|nr:PDZ/DHR/GLGF domain protein [Opisthorchis viverrini]